MGILDIFGNKKKKLQDFIERDAVIIDVRTPGEFSGGHPKGAINIPLDQIDSNMDKIKGMNKPVIACCASGMRSANAASKMRSGDIEAINGGGWTSVQSALNN